MSKILTNPFIERLIEAQDYRGFLAPFFKSKSTVVCEGFSGYTYAEIARRAGFKSRGYLRDLVHGSKPLTPHLGERMAAALKLNSHLKDYFLTLVRMSSDELSSSDRERQSRTLEARRARIQK